jgi:hypothetical protein
VRVIALLPVLVTVEVALLRVPRATVLVDIPPLTLIVEAVIRVLTNVEVLEPAFSAEILRVSMPDVVRVTLEAAFSESE